MDISSDARPPVADASQRSAREPSVRASTKSEVAVSRPLETSESEAPPEHGGVLASAEVEQGLLRDAAAQRETKDRVPDAESAQTSIEEALARLAKEARLPTNSGLTIRIDENSKKPSFLVFNKETKAIIREIPNPKIRELLSRMGENHSLFLDTKL